MASVKKTTSLIHHPYRAPVDFEGPLTAVHKASTVFFPSVEAMKSRDWKDKSAYTYGLHGTPTTFTLEERLCAIEGGLHCLLVPSGLAAIAQVNLAFLASGDEVLLPDNVYGPSKALALGELRQWGISHHCYNPLDVQDLAAKISPATRVVWLEAPGSITMEFPDLLALVQHCRERGVCCALDNTWGAGLAFNAFDLTPDQGPHSLGVDITVHALTKYPSGGGDVLMGSIITRDNDLAMRLKLSHMRLGLMVGANEVPALERSVTSTKLLELLKVTVLPFDGPVLKPDKMPENLPLVPTKMGLSMLESKLMVMSVTSTSAALAVNVTPPEPSSAPLDQPTNIPSKAKSPVSGKG